MSYILDALNKADKDRQQQTPAQMPTIPNHETTYIQKTSRKKLWLLLFVIILLSLALWLVMHDEETSTTQAISPKIAHLITPIPQPLIHPETTTPPQVQIQAKIKETIPNIMGLKKGIQSQLPPINISAHVYSADVSKRMVIINNQVKHEQQYIGEQLQLTHITPQGIQLQYQGTVFMMSVKDQWPPYP